MSSTAGSGVEVVAIDTPALGDRSYLAHDGEAAPVVDPQRDIDRVLDLAAARGVRITHVFETHLHNDYVTGGLALARAAGAAYHVNAADPVAFDRIPVTDRDVIEVSPLLRVRVLATPGHTFTHLSYVLEAADRPHAVFTGGSLLYGSTGRPDLLGSAHAEELAHAQFGSAHRLAAELPEDAAVYPTHGFGSFCSATQSEGTSSTIGRERQVNPVLTQAEERYVRELLAGLDAFPAYYAHMGPANAAGPSGPDLTPPSRADAAELRRRTRRGRHREPGRLGRRPGPAQLPRRRLRGPGGGPPPPSRGDPRCPPRPGVERIAHCRRRAHPPPRAASAPGRGARRRGVGALRGRLPCLGRGLLPGRGRPHGRGRGRRVRACRPHGLPLDGRSRRTGSSVPRFPAAGTLLRSAAGERHIRPPA